MNYLNNLLKKKYFLNSSELNELLGEESDILVEKYELFEWRTWRLIPKNKKYWIIENINT